MNTPIKSQPWIGKPVFDTVFILLPPFASLLFIMLFPGLFTNSKQMPGYWWVILILLVDVAHVYSTLYRTYFDKRSFEKHKTVLVAVPFIAFVAAVILYSVHSSVFWRVLAYIAVYHFIRQQYGFMRLYSRKESATAVARWIDTVIIYYATVYPLIFWHFTTPRNFNWFVDNDFVFYPNETVVSISGGLYLVVLAAFVVKESVSFIKTRWINIPKLTVIIGTAVSWYFGIVYYNGDLAFTLLNVVCHGIPYMALIWLYGKRSHTNDPANSSYVLKMVFGKFGFLVFLGIIFMLAFIEEGFWDMSVWKEHKNVFRLFYVTDIQPDHQLLSFVVPLLALPQITHYIIDGFIWRIRKDKSLH